MEGAQARDDGIGEHHQDMRGWQQPPNKEAAEESQNREAAEESQSEEAAEESQSEEAGEKPQSEEAREEPLNVAVAGEAQNEKAGESQKEGALEQSKDQNGENGEEQHIHEGPTKERPGISPSVKSTSTKVEEESGSLKEDARFEVCERVAYQLMNAREAGLPRADPFTSKKTQSSNNRPVEDDLEDGWEGKWKHISPDLYWSYEFLSETYVHGMMDGEAMRYQNERDIKSRVFELR